MASIGVNIARDGSTSFDAIGGFNVSWVRIVAMPGIDLSDYFRALRAAGIKILLVLARESGGDYAGYQRRYGALVDAVEVGNEPDLASPSSWSMTQAELVSLGHAVRTSFPRPFPLVVGGLASGHPEWLDGVDLSWADAIGIHPYGKTPSETWPHPGWGTGVMGPLLDGYVPFGKPLLVTELGLSTSEVSEPFQAEYLTRCGDYLNHREDIEVWVWFCISDTMV